MMQGSQPQGTNWKNVNNWHWVEKNCLPWTQDHLGKKLLTFEFKQDGKKVWVSAVKSVTGDVDLNQRKGKVIYVFDLALNLEWKGSSDLDDKILKGSITVPEWMHDSDDLEWQVSMESWTKETDKFSQMVKKKLCQLMEGYLLKGFSKDLMEGKFINFNI